MKRGLERRERDFGGASATEHMGPVITLMVGRCDDSLKKQVDASKLCVDPGHLNWAGVACFRKAWALFLKEGLIGENGASGIAGGVQITPLAAAYRCVHHWNQIQGPNVVTSMPAKWWRLFLKGVEEDKTIPEVEETGVTIDKAVDPAILEGTLLKIPFFKDVLYNENLEICKFEGLQPSKDTLNQFLSARDDLLKIVRARMIK